MTAPDAGIEALIERLRRTSEELQRTAVADQAELDQARAGWAAEDEARAAAARRGELGPRWNRLQARIDLGETSVDAVVRGLDTSADAQVVVTEARARAELVGEELGERIDDGDVPSVEAMRAPVQEISDLLAELQQLAAEVGGPDPTR